MRGEESITVAPGASYFTRSEFELPTDRGCKRVKFCSAAPHAAVSAKSAGTAGLLSAITREILLHSPST